MENQHKRITKTREKYKNNWRLSDWNNNYSKGGLTPDIEDDMKGEEKEESDTEVKN